MNFVIFLVDRVQQDLRKGIVKENSNGALNVCPNGIFVTLMCVFNKTNFVKHLRPVF